MTTDEIISEYYEAGQALRMAHAAAVSDPDLATLPKDVRDAKAALKCEEEIARNLQATVAYEQLHCSLQERWVEAHEEMIPFRKGSRAS